MYLPLAVGVPSAGVQVKGVGFINRALTPEEIRRLYEVGPPLTAPTSLTFSQWLASGIYDVSSTNETHPMLQISREILIKRVANILGASHPGEQIMPMKLKTDLIPMFVNFIRL